MPYNQKYAPDLASMRLVRDRVSAEEWSAREDLAALYRIVGHFRMTDTIYTHISMRVPGPDETFLINAFGLLYEEITASSLVRVGVDGTVIDDPTGLGINLAGFVIHGAIHEARPDVSCVIHTHTRAGIGVSAQQGGLLPLSQHAALLQGRIGYHAFEGVAFNKDEQARLVEDIGEHNVLILNNHGLLTAGRSPAEALFLMLTLERACEAQVAALAGGGPVRTISPESVAASANALNSVDLERDWAAMMRHVERNAPDFCN